MRLIEELAKLEREEMEEDGEEARLNAIEEDIDRLYRRIGVIVEYINETEKEVNAKEEGKEKGKMGLGLGERVGDV